MESQGNAGTEAVRVSAASGDDEYLSRFAEIFIAICSSGPVESRLLLASRDGLSKMLLQVHPQTLPAASGSQLESIIGDSG